MYWQMLEKQLWGLAMLVREQHQQDRRPPIPLNRCGRLRRTLDVRIYEVLLLHVRTRMIWDGLDADGDSSDGDGGHDCCGDLTNESSLELRSGGGGVHHDDSAATAASGWNWLAAAAH